MFVQCFSHDNIASTHLRRECKKSNVPSVCRRFSTTLWLLVTLTLWMPSKGILGRFESELLKILSAFTTLFFLNWWSPRHGVDYIYNCSTLLFVSSQYRSTFFSHVFPCRRVTQEHQHNFSQNQEAVGDVETHAIVARTLLDSLAEDLSRVDHDNKRELVDSRWRSQFNWCSVPFLCWTGGRRMQFCPFRVLLGGDGRHWWRRSSCMGRVALSHISRSCNPGLMVSIVTQSPTTWGSRKRRLLLIRNSQQETVAASSLSRNPFAALDDDQVDIVPLATNTGATEVARSVATLTPARVDAGLRMEVGLSRGGTPSVEVFDLFFKRGRWFIEQNRWVRHGQFWLGPWWQRVSGERSARVTRTGRSCGDGGDSRDSCRIQNCIQIHGWGGF